MNKDIEDLYKHASDYFEKYQDEELRDYLLAVAQRLEDADMMFHQFAYFLMHGGCSGGMTDFSDVSGEFKPLPGPGAGGRSSGRLPG
jgi:hypothetical protein